jgi:hypothetical protein
LEQTVTWKELGTDPVTGCQMFVSGAFKVLVAGPGTAEYRQTNLWHLSISHPHRYPDWDTIADARYSLMPDEITVAMFLPPRAEYVNLHKNCFHLHEVLTD